MGNQLSEIVRRSLTDYRANRVLFVPPLVGLIYSLLSSMIAYGNANLALSTNLVQVGLAIVFLNFVVLFLVILGQASMAGKVVLKGKTKLPDWGAGTRKYFFRVLGIGLAFIGIALVVLMIFGLVLVFTFLPDIIAHPGVPPKLPTLFVNPAGAFVVQLLSVFLITLADSVLYLWLAPAILDYKGVGTSLDVGLKTFKRSWKAFVGFFALFLGASVVVLIINDLPTITGVTIRPLVGSLTPTYLTSQFIEKLLSPLWFLITFRLYRKTRA
jgi:hypothetical protein